MRGFVSRHPGWSGFILFTILFVAFLVTQSWQVLEGQP
jgi:hypothetical protein